MVFDLRNSWIRAWQGCGAGGTAPELMAAVLQAWDDAQRAYHTRQHLIECLQLCERFAHLAEHPARVELALWFHDAVYDVRGMQNEERSARWAHESLLDAGAGMVTADAVAALVLATRHDVLPQGRDQQMLVDIDLAILGAGQARFAEYQAQIREEYAWVPNTVFRWRRRAILQALLGRQPLYNTAELRSIFERSARENLSAALNHPL